MFCTRLVIRAVSIITGLGLSVAVFLHAERFSNAVMVQLPLLPTKSEAPIPAIAEEVSVGTFLDMGNMIDGDPNTFGLTPVSVNQSTPASLVLRIDEQCNLDRFRIDWYSNTWKASVIDASISTDGKTYRDIKTTKTASNTNTDIKNQSFTEVEVGGLRAKSLRINFKQLENISAIIREIDLTCASIV